MGTCFVMMPFGGYFDGYYTNVIRHAVSISGLLPRRADEIYSTGAIIDDIHKAILNSEICIADVTGRNPNVSYELGMAHAAHKPVIIITQDLKDVPFDYRHLRIITYDPKNYGWEASFRSSVENTINEVLKNPSGHVALRAVQTDQGKMCKHLTNIFLETAYDLERINKMYCDEQGNTVIKTSWIVKAESPVYHLCHNVVADKPGHIEVRRVYDKLSARELEYVTIEKSSRHLSYFFLFKQFKEPGQRFEAETEVVVEGYIDLDKLTETGETMMSTQAVTYGIRYTRKEDWLYLPKNQKFADVYAEYLSHPQPDQIGARVFSVETREHYLLKMVYGSDQPYQQETAAAIRIPT